MPEPRELRRHLGVALDDHGFEIVRSLPREKGRYCESFGLPCQRSREDFLRGNRYLRRNDEIPRRRQVERAQPLANAFAERTLPEDEEGHVGTELRSQRLKASAAETELPKP